MRSLSLLLVLVFIIACATPVQKSEQDWHDKAVADLDDSLCKNIEGPEAKYCYLDTAKKVQQQCLSLHDDGLDQNICMDKYDTCIPGREWKGLRCECVSMSACSWNVGHWVNRTT